ncbi:hypothetical protein E3P94_00247, partial [Wallemia ichthyophaga]
YKIKKRLSSVKEIRQKLTIYETCQETLPNRISLNFTLKPAPSAFRRRLRERHTALLRVNARSLPGPTSKDAERAFCRKTSTQADKMLSNLPRGMRSVATQICSSHFPTAKSYRFRFKLSDSPLYSKCSEVDIITHMIFRCRKFDQARLSLRRIYGLGFLRFEMKYMLQMKTLLKLSTSFPKNILAPTRASPVAPLSFLLIYGTHAKNRMHLSHYNRQLSMQKKYR